MGDTYSSALKVLNGASGPVGTIIRSFTDLVRSEGTALAATQKVTGAVAQAGAAMAAAAVPAHTLTAAVAEVTKAETAAAGAAVRLDSAMDSAGNAMAVAGAKAAAGAAGFDKAAAAAQRAARAGRDASGRGAGGGAGGSGPRYDRSPPPFEQGGPGFVPASKYAYGTRQRADQALHVSRQSSSYETLSGRGPDGLLAAGQLGAMHRDNRGTAASYTGGRRILGARALQFGPTLDRSAQGAAGGMMGPILDRKAQNLSVFQKLDVATKRSRGSLVGWNKSAGETVTGWREAVSAFSSTPFGMMATGLGGIATGAADIAISAAMAVTKVVALGAALGVVAAVVLTKAVLGMAALAESTKLSFKYLTGSASEGKKWYDSSVRAAQDLGLNVKDTFDSFKGLRAQQFSLTQSKALVAMSADLVAVTGHADAAERSIRAITQIKSAGVLQGDELNQLAEAGVSKDLIYKELEKHYKTNRAGVRKKQAAGEIDAETAIAAIQTAVAQKLHTANPGDAARKFASTTLTGMWQRLTNLPDLLMLKIGEQVETGPVKAVIGRVSAALDKINTGSLAAFVQKMIGGLGSLVDGALAFGQGFGDSFSVIGAAMNDSGFNTRDMTELARSTGTWVAEFFGTAIRYGRALFEVISEVASSSGDAFSAQNVVAFAATVAGTIATVVVLGTKLAGIALSIFGIVDSALKLMGIKDRLDGKQYAPPPALPVGPRAPFSEIPGGDSTRAKMPWREDAPAMSTGPLRNWESSAAAKEPLSITLMVDTHLDDNRTHTTVTAKPGGSGKGARVNTRSGSSLGGGFG